MTEENKFNKEDVEFGIIGNPPEVVAIKILIAKYSEDMINRDAELRQAQARVLQTMIEMRKKKEATSALLKPNGFSVA